MSVRAPLPITPIFVLPYKRYAFIQLIQLANRYLDRDDQSVRAVASHQNRAICHDSDDRVFSHSTLWRFLAYLGGMTVSLSLGLKLFLKAVPESTIHRFTGSVSPRKYRSEQRSQILRDANRLLNLIGQWDQAFPKERFFPRFATRVRAP